MGGNFKVRALKDAKSVIKFYRGDVFIFTNGRTKFYLTNGRFVDSLEYDSFEDFLKRNVDFKDYFDKLIKYFNKSFKCTIPTMLSILSS